jgi:hypothetical protein
MVCQSEKYLTGAIRHGHRRTLIHDLRLPMAQIPRRDYHKTEREHRLYRCGSRWMTAGNSIANEDSCLESRRGHIHHQPSVSNSERDIPALHELFVQVPGQQ